jgi:hypothetical protein
MITKWTNIKSVLFELERWIPKDLYSEARLIEDCMRAVDKIGAIITYQPKIHFTAVTNHKFCLPNDCLQISQIAYKVNPSLSESELEEIRQITQIFTDTPYIGDSELPEQVWWDNWQHRVGWMPLRLSTNTFALSVHCDDSRNITSSCEHTYTVTPDAIVTTSCKEALIMVAYFAYPKDCDGNYMIPDDEYYKEALISYCLMEAWKFRWNLKEEGAGERYKEYQMLWGLNKAKATASIRMPDLANAENMAHLLLRLIPKNRRFDTFYRNLGAPENLDFKGFTAHSLYRN